MNRILVVVILLCSIQRFAYSQETRLITKQHSSFNEEYHVLAENKRIKHGSYIKVASDFGRISILETGSYDHGEKHGEWEYFYEDRLFFSRHYSGNRLKEKGVYVKGKKNGIWIAYHRDTVRSTVSLERVGKIKPRDSLRLNIDHVGLKPKSIGQYLNDKRIGLWIIFDPDGTPVQKYDFSKKQLLLDISVPDTTQLNTAHGPVYFGGVRELNLHILNEAKIGLILDHLKGDSATATLEVMISETGQLKGTKVIDANASAIMAKELARILPLLPNPWIPARKNGSSVTGSLNIRYRMHTVDKRIINISASVVP